MYRRSVRESREISEGEGAGVRSRSGVVVQGFGLRGCR